ncbi:hypothetical protein L6E12_27090 [Actinokineospora sp. PR83]|uniref:hypothetical protein n=1 Tax=Actinokineospora sp. PR83 TaxID=2884908 RepID=UPI001F39AE7C|nr:hypothetical protein [Actinokineospora sp. PR83]MCG8919447.1 hypothetical protein [Actinokineospora sp. PR83]
MRQPPAPGPHSGRPVRWSGPVLDDLLTDSYVAAVSAGATHPPAEHERVTLRPGAEGVVGDLIDSTGTDEDREDIYIVRFGDYTLETSLPPRGLLTFADTTRVHTAA